MKIAPLLLDAPFSATPIKAFGAFSIKELRIRLALFTLLAPMAQILRDKKFRIIDAVERLPYPNVEYATKRVYVWAEKFV